MESFCWMLKRQASRLGGTIAVYCFCTMGAGSHVLSHDVARALVRERVVEKGPSFKSELDKVQAAFDQWPAESGRPPNHISRALACSTE